MKQSEIKVGSKVKLVIGRDLEWTVERIIDEGDGSFCYDIVREGAMPMMNMHMLLDLNEIKAV